MAIGILCYLLTILLIRANSLSWIFCYLWNMFTICIIVINSIIKIVSFKTRLEKHNRSE